MDKRHRAEAGIRGRTRFFRPTYWWKACTRWYERTNWRRKPRENCCRRRLCVVAASQRALVAHFPCICTTAVV